MRIFLRNISRLILTNIYLISIFYFLGQDALAGINLLQNPGLEDGQGTPQAWTPFPPSQTGMTFLWDNMRSHSGNRSVGIESPGSNLGMWQQIINVEPGKVYELTGYVAFENIVPPGKCNFQLVFRSSNNAVLSMINLPYHTGTRDFAFDFPPKLKVRAPAESARVEVNLFLQGPGKTWFDDLFFGPASTGSIYGTVTNQGTPLSNVRVFIWGDPWNKVCEAFTDSNGQYTLNDIPVAFPRYVLMASKEGYKTRTEGDIEVIEGVETRVDFEMSPGSDPDVLQVKFGTVGFVESVIPPTIPQGATIPADASGYPEAVKEYLEPDEIIQSDHPDVVAKAMEILQTLPPENRRDTRKVAWAVYEWVCKNIDHDSVFSMESGGLDQSFRDVTSGIWQTISGEGWCWGKNFYDWAYHPYELLKVKCGICVEHAWLTSALFRALNIPARASVGSNEFWAQNTISSGTWVHMSTTAGRTSYRESGILGPGFEGTPPVDRFSVLSRPVIHEDWDANNKGLWREIHPWRERYPATQEGYNQALTDLGHFFATGEALPGNPPPPGSDCYQIHYSDITINLFNIGTQRTLDVRFPLVTDSTFSNPTGDDAYWSNYPECIKRTWIEEILNPPSEGMERWFHIEFDLTSLLDGNLPDLSGAWSNISKKKVGTRYRVSGKLTVSNTGTQKASRATVKVYLSDNATYELSDQYLGSTTMNINANRSASKTFNYFVTEDPTGKYLIALIDPDNTIQESNENNNIGVSNVIP